MAMHHLHTLLQNFTMYVYSNVAKQRLKQYVGSERVFVCSIFLFGNHIVGLYSVTALHATLTQISFNLRDVRNKRKAAHMTTDFTSDTMMHHQVAERLMRIHVSCTRGGGVMGGGGAVFINDNTMVTCATAQFLTQKNSAVCAILCHTTTVQSLLKG